MTRPPPTSGQPYDVTFKHMVERHPRDVLAFVGVRDVVSVEWIATECSTLIARADQSLKVMTSRGEFIAHLEFQTWRDPELATRMFWYNAALHRQYGLPVWTALILLTPKAVSPQCTGSYRVELPWGFTSQDYRFEVIRVWELPPETILEGGIGMLPLAPITHTGEQQLDRVLGQLQRRIGKVPEPQTQRDLWAATYFLMGLKYNIDVISRWIRGGSTMKGSVTYDLTLEEGRAEGREEGRRLGMIEGARSLILLLGKDHLGEPSPAFVRELNTVSDLDRLKDFAANVRDVASWQDLLLVGRAPRRPSRTRKKRK